MVSDRPQARLSRHECLAGGFSDCRLFTAAATVFVMEKSQ